MISLKELHKKGLEILKNENSKNDKSCAILDSRLILENLLCIDSVKFFTSSDLKIDKDIEKKYISLIKKRAKGYSIYSLLNKKEFYGRNFNLNKKVLVPRSETEFLCESAIEYAVSLNKNKIAVLDICTGSGVIGITLAKELELKKINVKLVLSDISDSALQTAERNAKNIGVECVVLHSNLFENIDGKFDIICANPPYIDKKLKDTLSEEVKLESKRALYSSQGGFSHIQRILKSAKNYMQKDSMLFIECGYDQGEKIIKCAKNYNYNFVEIKKDLQGLDRYAMIKI